MKTIKKSLIVLVLVLVSASLTSGVVAADTTNSNTQSDPGYDAGRYILDPETDLDYISYGIAYNLYGLIMEWI